jgi:hypothetical protein
MSSVSTSISLRFHEVREHETPQLIAARYGVDIGKITNENPNPKPGDILVINLKDKPLA